MSSQEAAGKAFSGVRGTGTTEDRSDMSFVQMKAKVPDTAAGDVDKRTYCYNSGKLFSIHLRGILV